jgi:hypothetical protein
VLAAKISKGFSWFSSSCSGSIAQQTAQKTVQVAEGRVIKGGAGKSCDYVFTKTAEKHLGEFVSSGENFGKLSRPYMRSHLTINEILRAGKGVPDAYAKGATNFRVPGTFRGSSGTWELVVDQEKKLIYHYNFVGK